MQEGAPVQNSEVANGRYEAGVERGVTLGCAE